MNSVAGGSTGIVLQRIRSSLTKDYRVWLVLALVLLTRLYALDAPVVGQRSWRQADTMAIAINFYENGYRLFYPQVDWGGETPGYVESEFPVYSYLSALLFAIFGVAEAIPRLLSVAFSLIGVAYYYALVRDLVNEDIAFWSALFVSISPLAVYMGRMIMPESLLLLSLITGVYFFNRWRIADRSLDLSLSAVFIGLACLIKIPSLYIGLPLLYLAWLKFGKSVFRQPALWLYAVAIIGPTAAWYYHAHQIYLHSGLTFGIWEYGVDKWGNWELIYTGAFWYRLWVDNIGQVILTWFGIPVFLFGLALPRRSSEERVFDAWLLALLVYFLIVSKGNYVHDYYQVPFTLPAAVYVGKVFARFFDWRRPLVAGLLSASLLGVLAAGAYAYFDRYLQHEDLARSEKYELAELIRQHTQPTDLILVMDNDDPTVLYLADRKGWHAHAGVRFGEDLASLDDIIAKGARYLAGRRDFCTYESQCEAFEQAIAPYEVVFRNRKYIVVKLAE